MIYCSVRDCNSNSENNKRRLFKCPLEDLDIAQKWVEFCRDPSLRNLAQVHICDLHFTDADFNPSSNGQFTLKSTAIPTVSPKVKKYVKTALKPGPSVCAVPTSKSRVSNLSSSLGGIVQHNVKVVKPNAATPVETALENKTVNVSQLAKQKVLKSPHVFKTMITPVKNVPKSVKAIPIKIVTNPDGSKAIVAPKLKTSIPAKVMKPTETPKKITSRLLDSEKKTDKVPNQNDALPKQTNTTVPIDVVSTPQIIEFMVVSDKQSESIITNDGYIGLINSETPKRKSESEDLYCMSKLFKCTKNDTEVEVYHKLNRGKFDHVVTDRKGFENQVFNRTRKTTITSGSDINFEVNFISSVTIDSDEEEVTPPDDYKLSSFSKEQESSVCTESYNIPYYRQTHSDNSFDNDVCDNLLSPPDESFEKDPSESVPLRKSSPRKPSSSKRPQFRRYLKRNKVVVNKDDPRYSIHATAESLGTFNSFIDLPLGDVDLRQNEWKKLFISSGIKYPKLTKSHINSMVNQLRKRLPSLNERDMLDALFVLNMMSMYPTAPEKLKEEMFQRLCMVFIATTFQWETALALVRKRDVELDTIVGRTSQNPYSAETFIRSAVASKVNDLDDSKLNKSRTKQSEPKCAFEIIVSKQERKKNLGGRVGKL